LATLDVTEIMQPMVYGRRSGARDMREFYQRSPPSAPQTITASGRSASAARTSLRTTIPIDPSSKP